MASLNNSSKIRCTVKLGAVSPACHYVATTLDGLKDQALEEVRRQCGPTSWEKATSVCLKDGSEILSTAALREHVSDGHPNFILVNPKLGPFERSVNLDLVCRLYNKLTQIGGVKGVRANVLSLGSDWKEILEIIIQADAGMLASKLGSDYETVDNQQDELYAILSPGAGTLDCG